MWLGKKGIVPHSVVVSPTFCVFLFVLVRARPSYRATDWGAVLVTANRLVEGCCTPDDALVC